MAWTFFISQCCFNWRIFATYLSLSKSWLNPYSGNKFREILKSRLRPVFFCYPSIKISKTYKVLCCGNYSPQCNYEFSCYYKILKFKNMHERKNLDPKLNDDETMTRFSFFLITLYKILISYMISFAIQSGCCLY